MSLAARCRQFFSKPHLRLISLAGILVPRRLRADWRQEWEAELNYREARLTEWDKLDGAHKRELIRRSASAFWDAIYLQPKRWEDEMVQDLRFGARMLLKHKMFSAAAILSLALGVGANTAIFQLIDAVRLRTLPVRAPHELAEVRMADMKGARGGFSSSAPTVTNKIWEQIRERQQAFSGIFAWGTDIVNLAAGGEVRPARAVYASGGFFDTLGLKPALGRFFGNADDQRGCASPGLVISYAFWQREYGGMTDAIGRSLRLSGHAFEIIGVTPANFFGMEVGRGFDLTIPLCANTLVRGNSRMLDSGINWWLTVTGRLKPGWSVDQASVQTRAMSAGLFEATLPPKYPPVSVQDYLRSKLIAVPAGSGISQLRQSYDYSLSLLLAIAGLVLLIACANLANLLLARASAREREIAVRQSLGATRTRLVRQLLVESLLLAVLGAMCGAALSQPLSRFLVALISTSDNPVFLDLSLDWRVLGFAAGLAVLTGLLFGLAPAIRSTQTELGGSIKTGGRGMTAGRERFNFRRILVVAQIALSLVLVTGAVLFSRTLGNLQSIDTGFRQDGVLIANTTFRSLRLAPDRNQSFKDELLERIRAIPGVESAAVTHEIPLRDRSGNTIWMDGADRREGKAVRRSRVGPDYFRTLQVRLVAGRDFDTRDRVGSVTVAIVNESFSRTFLQGANPVGRRFWVEATPGETETPYEIVGLVRDTKYADLREEFRPIVYDASAQNDAGPGAQFLVRSRLNEAATTEAIRRVLGEVNPAITVSFRGLSPLIEATILRERLMATLARFFGLLALTLACVGLYGVLSFNVASRANEIGIRLALGAGPRSIFWLIQREALILVAAGLLVGLPLIFAATRVASTMLFGLSPTDPVSLLSAALVMLAVAVVSGYLPSRSATRVDPMIALRRE